MKMTLLGTFFIHMFVCLIFIKHPPSCNGLFNFDNFIYNEMNMDSFATIIRLKVYTSWLNGVAKSFDTPIINSQNIVPYINISKPVIFYIHGYQEHPSIESVQTVVQAYLDKGRDNIILVDWSDMAFGNYITVILKVKSVARIVAHAIKKLILLKVNARTLHIVGHSLGAQIAGFIGKYSEFSIPRITALDPAKPGFYHLGAEHINSTDAEIVDIIHTDGGFYGTLKPTGTIDFFANGGTRPQPGCSTLFGIPLSSSSLCSHWRSWRFYAESVKTENAFLAIKCPSYVHFLLGLCRDNKRIYFGYRTPKNESGRYYFKTNANKPFGRGLQGIELN